jgi:magnesium-protoporphyrin IX monomethyl ester (oxidative) cyclase
MKITLIQPQKKKSGIIAEESWNLTRPFSLFYLAASIEKNTDCLVEIVDFEQQIYNNDNRKIDDKIKNTDSEIFGITCTTFTRFEAVEVAQKIKAYHPESLIVVGGVHFMFCAEETLQKISCIDFVVRGEGEKTIISLIEAIKNKTSLNLVKGITYRDNHKIATNPDADIVEDLDDLPIYSEFDWNIYPEYLFGSAEKIKAVSIMSSRGCPYKCVFCSKAGMKYRLRSPIKVVDEIEYFIDKFKISSFNFLDLTFTANPEHAQKICSEILKRKLKISWWCESRVNIPLELLDVMKEAGCKSLVIGVESGSPKILTNISKKVSLEQVVAFCKKCHEVNIECNAYFMFSHPEETLDDLEATEEFIFKIRDYIKGYSIQPTMIFPGTEIEKIAKEKKITQSNFSWYSETKYEINRELGQFDNIPLFIDKLTHKNMKDFMNGINIKESTYTVSKLTFKEIFLKTLNAIVNRKSSVKYIFSIKYIFELLKRKIVKTFK